MNMVFKGAVTAALLAGSTVAATAPAQADRGSTAVVAGIAGLAIGAAIASNNNNYGGGYYQEPVGYYGAAPAYYGGGYGYAPSYGYAYGGNYGYGNNYGYRGNRGWSGRGRGHNDHDRHDRGRHNGWDRDGRR
jgi:hypothetical protein